ncbi:MAG TPA: hypothetical protein DIS66_03795 [Candidatus Omnitrophica bacterium]|nr:hypothetical protein [Candidatus Omnitrophota bacterium]
MGVLTFKQYERRRTFWCWVFVVTLPMVWYWTRFVNPSFNLIDDAFDLRHFEYMRTHFSEWWRTFGFHGEAENGRLRTTSWLFRFFTYYLPCRMDPLRWNIAHFSILALTVSCLFFALRFLTGKNMAAVIACVLWVLSGNTLMNYTRFGPFEVLQVLWLSLLSLLAYVALSRSSGRRVFFLYSAIFFCLFMLYFTKETSILLLPFAALMLCGSLWLGKAKKEWSLFFGFNLVLFALQRYFSPPIAGYTSNFKPSMSVFLENAERYFTVLEWRYLLLAAIAVYCLRNFHKLFKKQEFSLTDSWQFGFFSLGCGFLAPCLLWEAAEPRYLLVSEFLFAGFMALELFTVWNKFCISPASDNKKKQWFKKAGLITVCLILAVPTTDKLAQYSLYAYGVADKRTPVQALQWLSTIAEKNAVVLSLEVEQELVGATAIFMKDIFGRGDIQIYSVSPFAEISIRQGYPMRLISLERSLSELEHVDYVIQRRSGYRRPAVDRFFNKLMFHIQRAGFSGRLQKIYSELYRPPVFKLLEGVEIWKMGRPRQSAIF